MAKVGETLTAKVTPTGATVNYQWQASADDGTTWDDIADATSKTYILSENEVGKLIRVKVTGTGNFTGTKTSDPVGPVTVALKEVTRADGDVTQDAGKTGGTELSYNFVAEGKKLTIDANNTKLPYYEADGSTPPRTANWVGVAIPIPEGVNTEEVTATINGKECVDLFFADGKYMEYIDVKADDLTEGAATYEWVIKWGAGYADETITIELINVAGLEAPEVEVTRADGDVTQDAGKTGGTELSYNFVAEGKKLTIDANNTKLPYYEADGSTPPRTANWVGVAIPIPEGVNTEEVTATINGKECVDLFFADGKYMEYIDVKDGDLTDNAATYTWVIKWGSGYADETITVKLINVAGLEAPEEEPEPANLVATGSYGIHDNKVYAGYELQDKNGAQIPLVESNIESMSVKDPDGNVTDLTVVGETDPYLWFNIAKEAGTYTYTVVTKGEESKTYKATLTWTAPTEAKVSFQAPESAKDVFTEATDEAPAQVDFSKVTADKLLDWTSVKDGYYAIELKIESVDLREENVKYAFRVYGDGTAIEPEIKGDLDCQYVTTDWELGTATMYYVLADGSLYQAKINVVSLTPADEPAPEVKGSIERDPANTGGELEVTIENDTVTFTSGEIKWYPEDKDLGRAAGNRVGVQINAPADFDTTGVTVKIGEQTYNWDEIKDGDGYFWWYPLVTQAGQQFTATVVWNESSTQEFKVVIGEGVTLEAAPDTTDPELKSVSPKAGDVNLEYGETFKLEVAASDENLYELEVDHNIAELPEFSVYASESDPYGGQGEAFAEAGVTVTYNAAEQKWIIDFGKAVTTKIVEKGGITFYLVLVDDAGNKWGSMDPTTPENTFAYNVTQDEAPEASTYKFSYEVPEEVIAGGEYTVPVTFATYVKGDFGYDGVKFKFVAHGPGDVTFKAVDSNGVEHTFTNEGYWGPAGGFNLPAEYSATTEWKLVFGAAGQYTITFSLIDADTEEVIAGITDSATVEVGAAPEVKGSIERDPANTGGDLEYIILGDTVTFTGGEIKWYPEDPVLGRAAGNRVGVQINAPAGFDTSGVTVTIGENTYNWKDIEDGPGYFWWYPLVTAPGQEFTATVVWNEASTQVFKVVIGSGVTLEAEPAIKGEFVSTGNVGIAPDTAGDAAGKIYAEYKLVAEGKDISLASGNVEYIKVKVGEGGWEDLTPNTDATLWFNVEKATGSYEFEVKTTDGKKYTAILNWDKEIKTATWEATGREGEHDGKTYVEYKLLDGEAKVSLKVGDVKLIAIKEGDKWVALEPNTDETLWFNKARETGSYEFFVVTSEGVMYRATLDWVKTKAAEVDYNAVWNGARGTWYIKVSVPGEDLDADSVQTIKVIREAGVDLAEPRALTPDTDKVLWFGVAKADGDLGYKGAGEYAYEVVRKDGSKYIFSFTYDPDAVQGVEIVTTQGELVPAADYPGYENWSAVFTAAGVDFGQITKDQAIAMGLPGKDYYGVAMYLMADGVQVDLSAGNVKRVVRTDPAGDMTEPIVSGDNKYQFVHDGWGGPGQYTIVYTLKDGRVIEAKINIVSFEFKVKEPKVITGLGVLARDADKISVSNVGLVDGVYTVTATALVELPEIESGTGVVGKWFGLLLMPGGIDSITELQYKTAYTGEFRDLTDADIAESGGAEQLVWWLNGSAEFPQAIELKYKGEADDTAIKLSVNFEDPFVDISAAIAAIAAGDYQDLQVDDVYSETDTTAAVQAVVDGILANLGLEGVTAEVTRAAEGVFTVTVRKGDAEKTTTVEATFVGRAEICYTPPGDLSPLPTVGVKVKVDGEFITDYTIGSEGIYDAIKPNANGVAQVPAGFLSDLSIVRVAYQGRILSVVYGGSW